MVRWVVELLTRGYKMNVPKAIICILKTNIVQLLQKLILIHKNNSTFNQKLAKNKWKMFKQPP